MSVRCNLYRTNSLSGSTNCMFAKVYKRAYATNTDVKFWSAFVLARGVNLLRIHEVGYPSVKYVRL
jgi:hypothetical protein